MDTANPPGNPDNGDFFATEQYLPAELTLGIREIDDQHQHLFELLALLKSRCFEYGGLPDAEADLLLHHLAEHFATEERIASQQGCDVEQHTRIHRRIFAGIERGMQDVRRGDKDVFALLRYIEYWFERHIVDEDVPLLRPASSRRQAEAQLAPLAMPALAC